MFGARLVLLVTNYDVVVVVVIVITAVIRESPRVSFEKQLLQFVEASSAKHCRQRSIANKLPFRRIKYRATNIAVINT